METLKINQFKGQETVKNNKGLIKNAAFYSRVKNFEGKLSSSHYVVKFPVTGAETYYTYNKKIRIENNSYLITNPKVEIEAEVKSDSEVIGICIGFTDDYLNNLAFSMGQKLNLSLDNPFINQKESLDFFTKRSRIDNNKFCNALQNIKYGVLNDSIANVYQEDEFYSWFGELLIENELEVHSKISQLPNTRLATREEIYRRVDIMDQYIYDNYIEDITIDKLSLVAGLSKYHAIRCYSKIVGVSPYQKVITLRIEKAKELLEKDYAISEVSDLCGFSDYRAFSKLFKRHFGFLPSSYKIKVLAS